ncbi:MAG: Fic family protein [Oscillospiraceae bacterium]|jgi:cell filamentation protein|nr:Fic family protein [Oscillospiraceae bacterium]
MNYAYSYEWDVRYCYENSYVLRNKLGLTDSDKLHEAERRLAGLKISVAKVAPIRGNLDFKHLSAIHKYIFGEIFEWAGELRTVNISKGNPFCNYNVLHMYGADLFGKLHAERYLLDTLQKHITERLAHYLSEINVMHPFREGNGRSQRLFIEYLALIAGYRVDFTDVTSTEIIEASVRAFSRDESHLRCIFDRITTPVSLEEQQSAIRAICGTRSKILRIFKENL